MIFLDFQKLPLKPTWTAGMAAFVYLSTKVESPIGKCFTTCEIRLETGEVVVGIQSHFYSGRFFYQILNAEVSWFRLTFFKDLRLLNLVFRSQALHSQPRWDHQCPGNDHRSVVFAITLHSIWPWPPGHHGYDLGLTTLLVLTVLPVLSSLPAEVMWPKLLSTEITANGKRRY